MDGVVFIVAQHALALGQVKALRRPEAHVLIREGADHQQALALVIPLVDVQVLAFRIMLLVVAVDGHGMVLAELDGGLVVVEYLQVRCNPQRQPREFF